MTTIEITCCDKCNASMELGQKEGVIRCGAMKAIEQYGWAFTNDTQVCCPQCKVKLDSPVKETPNDHNQL